MSLILLPLYQCAALHSILLSFLLSTAACTNNWATTQIYHVLILHEILTCFGHFCFFGLCTVQNYVVYIAETKFFCFKTNRSVFYWTSVVLVDFISHGFCKKQEGWCRCPASFFCLLILLYLLFSPLRHCFQLVCKCRSV